MKCKKLLIVTNIPNQYRIPLFNALNLQLKQLGVELLVVFGVAALANRKSKINLEDIKFNYHILQNKEVTSHTILYNGLTRLVLREKPDSVIVGGFSIPSVKLALLNYFKAFQLIIWTGSFLNEANQISIFKQWLRSWLFSKVKHWLAYSSLAKQYIEKNVPSSVQVINVGNTVDTQFFSQTCKKLRLENSIDFKKNILTYVGYLSKRKNVSDLIEVIYELRKLREDFYLDIIGDGEEKNTLENKVHALNLSGFVNFHGFKQKNELPNYLAFSNAFLFQTSFDIWGLVLNEAMASEIPCFASVNAGSTNDLIKHGENGFAIDFRDAQTTADIIHKELNQKENLQEVAKAGALTISECYTLESCANRMISILQ